MKNNIISTVDGIMYLLFVVVAFIGGTTLFAGNAVHGFIILVAGWLIACLLSGTWFVLSQMAENGAQTNALLKRLLDKEV